jgi:hypothetical protein
MNALVVADRTSEWRRSKALMLDSCHRQLRAGFTASADEREGGLADVLACRTSRPMICVVRPRSRGALRAESWSRSNCSAIRPYRRRSTVVGYFQSW